MRLRYLMVLSLCAFFSQACATPEPRIDSLPALSFYAPVNAEGSNYLGIPSKAVTFTLNDVDARVVLVEIFQVQCSHCQDEAPHVNKLFARINREGLYNQVKVMAIAYGNTPSETSMYGHKYHVPFALLADPGQQTFDIEATPAYFLLQPLRGGGARVLYSKYGALPETDTFIKIIKEDAGLK